MGSFFSNVQVFAGDRDLRSVREEVISAVKGMLAEEGYQEAASGDRRVVICEPGHGPWLTVYDSEIENLGAPLEGLALCCSEIGPAVAINVQDSDVLRMCLVVDGAIRDFFVSAPEYLDVPKERYSDFFGKPEVWEEFLDAGVTAKDFAEALVDQALFAEDQLADIADLLGWDTNQCLLGLTYWESEENRPRGLELRFCKQ